MLTTTHTVYNSNNNKMAELDDNSVDLIVTSPPYPMVKMWDVLFSEMDNSIESDLAENKGLAAYHKMHRILNGVWDECDRVLKHRGFICVNIGDATRTVGDVFQLYPNHCKIIEYFQQKGYAVLPDIYWRKVTNAPNKFMGSGMLPCGAYVTYEHEHILIFRKSGIRIFPEDKDLRRNSAYFYEERNIWFSDLWDIPGTSQNANNLMNRTAPYPLEIPFRLINMYSIKGDVVLDPFMGLGTTSLASMISQRNSIGYEIEHDVYDKCIHNLSNSSHYIKNFISNRIKNHLCYINNLSPEDKKRCYKNKHHKFEVKTKQESDILIETLYRLNKVGESKFECQYEKYVSMYSNLL